MSATLSATLEDVIALAAKHFAGITDKSGQSYVLHGIRVMMGVDDLNAIKVGVMQVKLTDLRDNLHWVACCFAVNGWTTT